MDFNFGRDLLDIPALQNVNPRMRFLCPECDLFSDGSEKLCYQCGCELAEVSETHREDPIVDQEEVLERQRWLELVDFLGEDFREMIETASSMRAPQRMVSETFLKSLSRVTVDEKHSILYDCCLRLGSHFEALLTPAAFSSAHEIFSATNDNQSTASKLVFGHPECGESDFSNMEFIEGRILVLYRGCISFAEKCRRAKLAGAVALIVIQTLDVWPFIMTDSSKELEEEYASLPVFMISKLDGNLLKQLYCRVPAQTKLELIIRDQERDCSICCETFVAEDVVLKLLCRHVYHEKCVLSWLREKNSCPLCRKELVSRAK